MFTGFIFDVEGILGDSVPQNLRSLDEALESFDYEIPKETHQLYSGLDGDQTLQLVVPDADEPERQAILKAQGQIYEIDISMAFRPFGGVRDVLTALTGKAGGSPLRRIARDPALKHYLSLLEVDDLITAMACGDDVEPTGSTGLLRIQPTLAQWRLPQAAADRTGGDAGLNRIRYRYP